MFYFMNTSLASHFVPLQASPAGLLGRFAPSGFALSARILGRFAPSKFSKKKIVSQLTQNGLKRVKMQKKIFTPLTRFARSAASAASGEAQPLPLRSLRSLGLRASRSRFLVASRSLPTPCHSQGPKECPCQVSCRSDQNCGR